MAGEKSFIGENALAGKETENPSLSLQLTAFRLLFSYRIFLLVWGCVCMCMRQSQTICAKGPCAWLSALLSFSYSEYFFDPGTLYFHFMLSPLNCVSGSRETELFPLS